MSEHNYVGLCYRCQHRLDFLEKGRQPRCQCGDIDKAVGSCYMFKPIKPLIIVPFESEKRIEGLKRPLFGPAAFAGRKSGYEPNNVKLDVIEQEDGFLLHWVPVTTKSSFLESRENQTDAEL